MGDPKGRRVTVLGAGNLGLATAAHLALAGIPVTLWDRSEHRLAPIRARGGCVEVEGIFEGSARLETLTTSYEVALSGCSHIIITTTADAHGPLAEDLAHFVRPGQHLILHPGYLFGAVEVHRRLVAKGGHGISVSEISNGLFSARAREGRVAIHAMKQQVGFATLPAADTHKRLADLADVYGESLTPYDDVLETGLHTLNMLLHPFTVMMNAGRIEEGAPFSLYHQGVTPHVARVIEAADHERLAVCRSLGLRAIPAAELMKRHYPAFVERWDGFYEACQSNRSYASLRAPAALYTRFIWEDVGFGLQPLLSLADHLGVEAPTLRAMVAFTSAAFDEASPGRTLEGLGLAGMEPDALRSYVRSGSRLRA